MLSRATSGRRLSRRSIGRREGWLETCDVHNLLPCTILEFKCRVWRSRKGSVYSGDSGGLPNPSTQTKTNLQVERSAGTAGVTVLLVQVWGGALISMEHWKSSKKV